MDGAISALTFRKLLAPGMCEGVSLFFFLIDILVPLFSPLIKID